MVKSTICLAAVALVCGACASSIEAPPVPLSEVAAPETISLARSMDYRAGWTSRLIGEPVIDPAGRHLGLLSDFIVHTDTGAVRYAIVSDKRLERGERLVPVPVHILWMTGKETLFLEMERERFERQKSWIAGQLQVHDEAAWNEVDRLWGLQPLPANARASAYRVSRLMGQYVDDRDGRRLGRIIDVVIDMNRQQVHYTVLRLQGLDGVPPDNAFAVPMSSLDFRAAGSGRVVLAVPQAQLISLIGTDPAHPPVDGLRYLGAIDRPYGVAFPPGAGPAVPSAVGATR